MKNCKMVYLVVDVLDDETIAAVNNAVGAKIFVHLPEETEPLG